MPPQKRTNAQEKRTDTLELPVDRAMPMSFEASVEYHQFVTGSDWLNRVLGVAFVMVLIVCGGVGVHMWIRSSLFPASLLAARAVRERQRREGGWYAVAGVRAATEEGGTSGCGHSGSGGARGGGGRAGYSLLQHRLFSGLMPMTSSTNKGRGRERDRERGREIMGRSSESFPDRFELSSSA